MSDNSTARIDPEEAARLLEAAFFFDQDAMVQVDSDLDEQLPLVKGYHLTRPLGEGGFGIVYEAEQCSPIQRRVALKILRQGLTTRELLARFEQERQALALMNHPHIARIHDAGETDDGRPFIAMEMVDGTTIDRFPDLDTAEKKVRLLAQVCHAVAHAHHRGVIHRDLKPSNILVTTGADGTPEPKVIDFGIAKALEGPLITRVFFTGMYQMVGTPGYMGPERQSSTPGGQAADTRSDVFALGAVLWELLSGQRPHVSTENETIRVVLPEGEPVPRELRWIAAMATALDMERRYPDAASLAADLEAWLEGKPVRAAAPGYLYLLGKWARRHPWSFVSLATSLLALAIAMAVVVLQNRRIGEQLGDLKAAAAENLRQSAEQNFLLGRNAISSSPLEGILRWQECLRQNPDHLRAKTFLKSAFAQMHLVEFLGESESLTKGNWRDMQISPNGQWVGVRGADEKGLAIWTAPLGGGWKQTTMPTRAKEPWIITNEGEVLDAGKTKCPLVGLRFLRMTRSGYLAAAGANGFGWRNPTGDWQIFPLAQTTSSMVVSADGNTLAVSAGEQIQVIDQSSDTASSFEKLRAAPISAFAISPNGTTIAAAWRDGMIQIMTKGHPSREVLHEAAVLDLFLTNDPETLVLRDPQGLAWLDLRQLRPSPAREKSASTAARWCLPVGDSCAVFSAPGGDLRVLDKRGNNVSSWQLPGVVGGEFTAASEDGLTFAALDEPSQRFRWFRMHPAKQIDIETPTVNDGLLCIGDGDSMQPTRFHRDGTLVFKGVRNQLRGGPFRLAAMSHRNGILFADRESRDGLIIADQERDPRSKPWPKPSALAISPSGQWLALGTPDGRHAFAPVESESLNWQSNPTGSPITAVAIRDDGRMARAAGGRITISDTTRGDLQTFSTTTVTSLAFSPVGDRLAIATADGKVQWHDASTGLDLALPNRIPGKVGCMNWIADSDELLVMLAQGGSVKLATPETVKPANTPLPTSLGWRLSEDGQIIPDASHVPSDGSPRSPRTK